MLPEPYWQLPSPPPEITPGAILARFIDGIAFRYHWATEQLRPDDLAFRCCKGSMSILEALQHIWRMTTWVSHLADPAMTAPGDPPTDYRALRRDTIERLKILRAHLIGITPEMLETLNIQRANLPEPLPFWNLITGPLSDILTHVGQINTWRRMNGNPVAKVNYLTGK